MIEKHPRGTPVYPVYVANRTLVARDYLAQLRQFFGADWVDSLSVFSKEVLGIVWRFNHFSKANAVSAKQAAFTLWFEQGRHQDIQAFDAFYRKVRRAFNSLEEAGYIERPTARGGYFLRADFKERRL